MTQAGPWSVRGLDPELRGAAADAARRAGLSLNEWLSTVIADTVDEDEFEPAPPPAAPRGARKGQDPLDAVAQRIAALNSRGSTGAVAAAQEAHRETDMGRVAKIIDTAVAALDEGQRQREEKTASALDAMTKLIERSGRDVQTRTAQALELFETSARQREEKTATVLEQVTKLVERSARETEARTARAIEGVTTIVEKSVATARAAPRRDLMAESPALRETLGKIASRIDSLDQRFESEAVPNPVREMIGRLETRLETISATPTPAPAVEASLKDLETRLREISRKLDTPAAAPAKGERDEKIGQIEGKLATILETLQRTAAAEPAPPPAPRRVVLPRRVANGGFAGPDLQLDDAIADITQRQRDLEGQRAPAASARPAAPDDSTLQALDDIRRQLSGLDERLSVPAVAPALEETAALRTQIAELSRAIEHLAPRETVLSIERAIRGLAARVEESRDAGVRSADMRPVERLLGDLRDAVETLRDPAGIDLLRRDLKVMADRIAAAPLRGTDNALLETMHAQMSDLRDLVSRAREPLALDDLDSRIGLLAERMERVANRPADTMATAGLASAVDDVRATLKHALPTGILARIEAKLGDLGALEQQLGAISSKMDRVAGRDDLDRLTEQLERMQASFRDERASVGAPASTGGDLTAIEAQIGRLAERLDTRAPAAPDLGAIETTLRELASRIGPAERSHDDAALASLEAQISRIGEQLDLHNGGLASIGNLGRSINDLFVQLEDVRAGAAAAAERAAISAVRDGALADGYAADTLSRDLADLRAAQNESDRRTQTTLSAVHDTLGRMVERLEQIDRGGADMRAAREPSRETAKATVKAAAKASAEPAPSAFAQPEVAPKARGAREAAPDVSVTRADRAAPVDMPLEPGSGRPRPAAGANANASDSKAALFAAARRAAQAAAQQSAEALKAQREAGVAAHSGAGGSSGVKQRIDSARAFVNARKTPILIGLVAAFIGVIALNMALGSKRDDGRAADSIAEAKVAPAPAEPAMPAEAPPPPAPRKDKVTAVVPLAEPQTVGSIDAAPASRTAADRGQTLPPAASSSLSTPAAAPADLGNLASLAMPVGSDRLRVAALAGDTAALYEIALRYSDGRGVAKDPAAAAKFFEAAARLGSAPAQYRLGALYREGRGVANDKAAAMSWFRKAADAGNARAMHNLGVILAEGYNGQPDYAAAAEWFGRASDLNVRDSQYNLAILYARGLGVGQDLGAAYKWFNAAANQGDEDAKKKRDEVAGRVPAEQLTQMKAAAEGWKPLSPDPRANDVAQPSGGWDNAPKVMPKAAKPAKSV